MSEEQKYTIWLGELSTQDNLRHILPEHVTSIATQVRAIEDRTAYNQGLKDGARDALKHLFMLCLEDIETEYLGRISVSRLEDHIKEILCETSRGG